MSENSAQSFSPCFDRFVAEGREHAWLEVNDLARAIGDVVAESVAHRLAARALVHDVTHDVVHALDRVGSAKNEQQAARTLAVRRCR